MSTISTSYNSMSTVLLTDFFSKTNKKTINEVAVLYVSTALAGVISIIIAIGMIDVKGVLDVWWKYASIGSGGMLGLFLVGIISPLKNNFIIALLALFGILSILWVNVSNQNLFHPYLSIVLGTTVLFSLGLFASKMLAGK